MKNKEKDKNYFNLDKPEEKDVLVKITKDKFESKKSKYIIYRKNEFEVSKRTSFFETDELLQLILIEHKLKPSGMKMFLYVVGNLKFENDWIEIKTEEPITSYVFRYSYANIAKQLGYSKDLIAEALGHEYGNSVTGIYLEQFDLALIDEMNEVLVSEVKAPT